MPNGQTLLFIVKPSASVFHELMKLCAAEGIHLPPGPLETAGILMLQFVQTQQEQEFKIISRKKITAFPQRQ